MKTFFKTFCAVTLVCCGLCSCQQARLKRVRVAPEGVSVKVMEASAVENVSQRSYVGSIEVSKEASVSAVHGGVLEQLLVREGDKVREGQVLAVINSSGVKSAYDAAKAALQQAEDGYRRASQVYQSGSVSEVKMVELRTKVEQARSSAEAASNALDECSVKAPFSGRVSAVNVNRGERVMVAQPLLNLVDLSGLEISFSVPENEVSSVKAGSTAKVYVPALDSGFDAVVKNMSVVGSTVSHSYKCTLAIKNVTAQMLPGMVCRVYLASDEVSGTVVPQDAVKIDGDGRYVWTVDASDKVCKTRITTGGFSGKGVVVTSGLSEGDRIIVQGSSKVSTGMKVIVK